MVTIYTNQNCVACEQTKKAFDKAGVNYETKDLRSHPEALETFLNKGYRSAPIVVTETDEWSGLNLYKIQQTIQKSK